MDGWRCCCQCWVVTQFVGSSKWHHTLDSSHSSCLSLQQALHTTGRFLPELVCLLVCIQHQTQSWKFLWVTKDCYCHKTVSVVSNSRFLCLNLIFFFAEAAFLHFCFFVMVFLTASTAVSVSAWGQNNSLCCQLMHWMHPSRNQMTSWEWGEYNRQNGVWKKYHCCGGLWDV